MSEQQRQYPSYTYMWTLGWTEAGEMVVVPMSSTTKPLMYNGIECTRIYKDHPIEAVERAKYTLVIVGEKVLPKEEYGFRATQRTWYVNNGTIYANDSQSAYDALLTIKMLGQGKKHDETIQNQW